MLRKSLVLFLLPAALLWADPVLQVDRLRHSFGEIPPGAKVRATFQVTNAGDGVLHVLRVVPSCECTEASVTGPVFLKAQESTTVEMVFDPAKDKGPIDRSIYVFTDAPRNARREIHYDAEVVYPVMASAEAVFFPDTLPHDTLVHEVKFRSTGSRDLALALKTELPPFLQVTLAGSGREATAKLVMDGSKLPREGASNGKLAFATGVPELPEIPLEFYAYAGHAVHAEPEGLAFDPALTGKRQAYHVKLTEIRNRPFRITVPPAVGAPFKVRLLTRGARVEHELVVSLGADVKAGSYTGAVTLQVDDLDQRDVEIKVTANLQQP